MLMRLLVTGSILILGLITLTMYKKEAPDELDAHQQVLKAHEQLEQSTQADIRIQTKISRLDITTPSSTFKADINHAQETYDTDTSQDKKAKHVGTFIDIEQFTPQRASRPAIHVGTFVDIDELPNERVLRDPVHVGNFSDVEIDTIDNAKAIHVGVFDESILNQYINNNVRPAKHVGEFVDVDTHVHDNTKL